MHLSHIRNLRITNGGHTGDLIFLTGVVLASVTTYVVRLGFYSDDWAFLAVMSHSQDQSLAGLFGALWDFNATLRMRPTQIAFQTMLYSAFGLEPLGYHVVNAVLLAGMIALLYLVLLVLRVPRSIALSVALVYALLPSYSTDRFWFAAFGYALSMALALGSIYADLRALGSSRRLLGWKIVSLVLLASACFGYEIVIPLLLVSPVLTWIHIRRRHGEASRLLGIPAVAYLFAPYPILAFAIGYKASIASGSGFAGEPLFYVVRLVVGAVTVHFGSFGIGLPHAAWWSIGRLPAVAIALGIVLGLVVFLYLMIVLRGQDRFAVSRTWVRLAAAGALVFTLGYAIFLTTARIGFSSSGPSNRTGLAAAMGAAAVVVAGVGLLTSRASTEGARRVAFAASIGTVCSMGFFVVGALGEYWVASSLRQDAVLRDIRTDLPSIPPGTTIVLHGVCPYEGPAVVFESSWDLDGVVKIAYGDPTLSADVTTSNLTVGSDGIETTVYGGPGTAAFHPYGEQLRVYDHVTGRIIELPDEQAALDYFGGRDPDESGRCPPGAPGYGEVLLPADRLFRALEARGFRPW
jgi:hypothetical protein